MKITSEILEERRKISIDLSTKIETTLEKFGIKGKIAASTFNKNEIFLELYIYPGTKIEDVERLSKTLAAAISAPTGKIKIEAPASGKAFAGIKIPLKS